MRLENKINLPVKIKNSYIGYKTSIIRVADRWNQGVEQQTFVQIDLTTWAAWLNNTRLYHIGKKNHIELFMAKVIPQIKQQSFWAKILHTTLSYQENLSYYSEINEPFFSSYFAWRKIKYLLLILQKSDYLTFISQSCDKNDHSFMVNLNHSAYHNELYSILISAMSYNIVT